MGIGMALTEETMFDDRTGRIVNASLAEYHVPVRSSNIVSSVSAMPIPMMMPPRN